MLARPRPAQPPAKPGQDPRRAGRLTCILATRTFPPVKPAKIVLIPTLVGLNLVMGWIVVATKLPIFLDSIGITIAAILAGPWVAIAVAVATRPS